MSSLKLSTGNGKSSTWTTKKQQQFSHPQQYIKHQQLLYSCRSRRSRRSTTTYNLPRSYHAKISSTSSSSPLSLALSNNGSCHNSSRPSWWWLMLLGTFMSLLPLNVMANRKLSVYLFICVGVCV